MLKNYLKTSLRNLVNGRMFTVINIAGLAVGISCFIILTLFISDELSFDTFNEKADRIYRVYVDMFVNGERNITSKTASLTGQALIENFPEVQSYTRLGQFVDPVFSYGDKSFQEYEIFAVDSAFFDIFAVKFVEGNSHTALKEPYSIVLTEDMANKYFGNEPACGKLLRTEENENYLVTAVIKNFPKNSHFSCNFITSIYQYKEHTEANWLDLNYSTYVMLKKDVDAANFEKKLKLIVDKYVSPNAEASLGISMKQFYDAGNRYDFKIQPFASIYLYSTRDYSVDLNTEWGEVKNSDIQYVYIFSIVAGFILLIAVINFMNLSTARSEKRAKEVGIRKTLGSNRKNLIWQFITESIAVTFVATLIALVLTEILLPFFNSLSGKDLKLELLTNPFSIPLLLFGIFAIGLISGSYPAFFLSSYEPIHVFKANGGAKNRKSKLRSMLVILQFSISITLLIGTLLIKEQLDFIQNKNLGFNKEHLLTLYGVDNLGNENETFKDELLKNSKILSGTYSGEMFRAGIPGNGYFFDKEINDSPVLCQYIDADYDFIDTYGIKLKEGRFFQEEFSTDTTAIVINEAILKEHAIANPVGKIVSRIINTSQPENYRIIGVISDFNYESLHKGIRPLVVHLGQPRQNSILTLRISSEDVPATIAYINDTWKEFTKEENAHFRFVDANIAKLYENEERTSVIAGAFTFLAIFIASLGLFALAAFVTEQKTKEIGIRKVLGASIPEIIVLLSKQFTLWVIIANIIAWPIAYYFMETWLQDFAFRIEIGWNILLLAALLALSIALLTISYQTIKAALSNPVKALKYE